MNTRQAKARKSKITKRTLELRNQLWPKVTSEDLWDRQERDGYCTIPRGMVLILRIMDHLSNGKPVSSTYFSLWCHVFDEGMVTINNPREMAFEAGFGGQRAENTWNSRMKILIELGFIESKPGRSGPYTYVLILNPYQIAKKHFKGKKFPEALYNALLQRAQDIGADDLSD